MAARWFGSRSGRRWRSGSITSRPVLAKRASRSTDDYVRLASAVSVACRCAIQEIRKCHFHHNPVNGKPAVHHCSNCDVLQPLLSHRISTLCHDGGTVK
jgi:hypothetical protein